MSRRARNRPDRMTVARFAAVASASLCVGVEGARAFDFFGLFGSDDKPPPVSPTAISYSVAIDVAGGDGRIKSAVNDASSLYRLRKDPPPDGDFSGAAREQRLRRDPRRAVGPRLLQRDRGDLDRRRVLDHRLPQCRRLRPSRRRLSQPRPRAGDHQGRSRPAVPAPRHSRRQRRRRGLLARDAARARGRPQAGRPRSGERPAVSGCADRRLFS